VTAALLLPVAPPTVDDMDEQLASLSHLSCNVPKLSLAYSVPNSVPLDGIAAAVGEAVRSFDVRAVKLHPNISCIDPESDAGMERIFAVLAACDEHNLPLVVHGGKSPILGSSEASAYASLERIARIDWSFTRATVVIAHCGAYGCSEVEVNLHLLP